MLNTIIKNSVLMLILLTSFAVQVKGETQNSDVSADMVWVEVEEGNYLILHSALRGGTWSLPSRLYSSEHEIVTPAIIVSSTDEKTLIWSEWLVDRAVLRIKNKLAEAEHWLEAKTLYGIGRDNIAPSMIRDSVGDIRLFWCRDHDRKTEILAARRDSLGDWEPPTVISDNSSTTNIGPEATLDEKGDIIVTWSQYDSGLGRYVKASKKIVEKANANDANFMFSASHFPDVGPKQLSIPNFMSTRGIAFIYVSTNTFKQSFHRVPDNSWLVQ